MTAVTVQPQWFSLNGVNAENMPLVTTGTLEGRKVCCSPELKTTAANLTIAACFIIQLVGLGIGIAGYEKDDHLLTGIGFCLVTVGGIAGVIGLHISSGKKCCDPENSANYSNYVHKPML